MRHPARHVTVALVAALALAALAAAPAMAQDGNDTEASANVSFGSQISIIVSAQQSEVEKTVENDAFDIAFGERGGDAVNERAQELREEMRQLQERKQALDRARENGNVSASAYETQMAKLATEAEAVNASANHTASTAEKGLSQAEQQGVNVSAIRELQQNASELTGPEVADLARSIAGPAMAERHAGDRMPDDAGMPDDVGPAAGNDSGADGQMADRMGDRGGAPDDGDANESGDVENDSDDGPGGAGGAGGPASGPR